MHKYQSLRHYIRLSNHEIDLIGFIQEKNIFDKIDWKLLFFCFFLSFFFFFKERSLLLSKYRKCYHIQVINTILVYFKNLYF